MERREFKGNVITTNLNANITNTSSTITLLNANSFPTGTTAPFAIVIDRGLLNEEKILISSRTANTLTVSQRGYDGTVANSHNIGAVVSHVLDATCLQDMNQITFDNEIFIWMGV